MTKEIIKWYFIMGFITSIIGAYRAFNKKQTIEAEANDVVSWFVAWWIYLPIFIFRYIKYKLRGKSL